MSQSAQFVGQRAEQRVFTALATLPPPWQFFPSVEWRTLQRTGESIGEADVVVFHPQYGLVVFEIKAGEVNVRDGVWYYASGLAMKQSPFSQARRNRYALFDKLSQRFTKDTLAGFTLTHAAWFPDVIWQGGLPGTEAPSRAFLFDRTTLDVVESALLRLFREASADPAVWTRSQQHTLKEVLAPDCRFLVPLVVHVNDTVQAILEATTQQMMVLRMLYTQPRLLVEGGAGSGKTVLACALAREHAKLNKKVLLTCFNRQLALFLANYFVDISNIRVLNFHELVKQMVELAGMPYLVPEEATARANYFREGAAEQLLNASEFIDIRFDTIIVDEAADFAPTWWVALEALGQSHFSWFCFYDRQQDIYLDETLWQPPFVAASMMLDINLRNPKHIGEFASRIGGVPQPATFRVNTGSVPVILRSESFLVMADQLRQLLRDLMGKESIKPEQIVILAPYRYTNLQSAWAAGLDRVVVSDDLAYAHAGKVRVGTIQGFKGLEADVVILAGIDAPAAKHPEWLYIGASRARGMLYILALEESHI